jgi:16S rRNA G966 N2-methylase RsmD
MIENYLNKRYSTRNLSDTQFEDILPQLAQELQQIDFKIQYDYTQLQKDWQNLKKWDANVYNISSTQRIGMKLCEHFFPNFYDIEDNNGNSFAKLWTAKNLEKVLRWNRKSHSTPYLSELKRGIYFNFGLTKSTMYRPQMAKMIINKFQAKTVFDPCAGWGGRMVGAIAGGADHYYTFEPNTETYNGLLALANFLGIKKQVSIFKDSALNMKQYNISNIDVVLTSPPYFNLEVYSHEDTQSITGCNSYREWVENFLTPLVIGAKETLTPFGRSCWNLHNVGKMKMIDDVAELHKNSTNNVLFSITSSKRQSNQYISTKNAKNCDLTICYSV